MTQVTRSEGPRSAPAGRVALVTGASSGIGRELARRLAAPPERCAVALVARTRANLESLAAEINRSGGKALVVPADVGDPEQADRTVRTAVDELGRLDVLVNAAGVSHPGDVGALSAAEVQEMIATNLGGVIATTRAALPALTSSRGVVVNIASLAGLLAPPGLAVYAATKFGVMGFSDALRIELHDRGVRVIAVCPTYVSQTRMLAYELERGPLLGYDPRQTVTPADVAAATVAAIHHNTPVVVVAPGRLKVQTFLARLAPRLAGRIVQRMWASTRRAHPEP